MQNKVLCEKQIVQLDHAQREGLLAVISAQRAATESVKLAERRTADVIAAIIHRAGAPAQSVVEVVDIARGVLRIEPPTIAPTDEGDAPATLRPGTVIQGGAPAGGGAPFASPEEQAASDDEDAEQARIDDERAIEI